MIPNNTHFDTTRANIEFTGPRRSTSSIAEGLDPAAVHPFKGNMDLDASTRFLAERAADVPAVFVTDHEQLRRRPAGVAGEPARACGRVCDRYGVPLFLDACRFAENAWFIREREAGLVGSGPFPTSCGRWPRWPTA